MVVLAVLNLHPAYRELLVRSSKRPLPNLDADPRHLALMLDDRSNERDVSDVHRHFCAMLPSSWRVEWAFGDLGDDPTRMRDALKLSTSFWRELEGYERVLTFEADSLMTGPLTDGFLAYDYIGAVCGGFDGKGSVLNGGFSLRNPRAMLRCLREVPLCVGETTLRDGRKVIAEDAFFTRACRQLGLNVAPDEV